MPVQITAACRPEASHPLEEVLLQASSWQASGLLCGNARRSDMSVQAMARVMEPLLMMRV